MVKLLHADSGVDVRYFETCYKALGDTELAEVTDVHSHTSIPASSAHVANLISMRCEWTEGGL